MRQPYETIFAPFRNHPILKPYFQGEVPDWQRLFSDAETLSPELDLLSSGEVTLLWVGLAIWNGNRTATVADLGKLDRSNRLRVLSALALPNT